MVANIFSVGVALLHVQCTMQWKGEHAESPAERQRQLERLRVQLKNDAHN